MIRFWKGLSSCEKKKCGIIKLNIEKAQILAQNLDLPEYVAQLLVNRSILTIEEAKKFVYPELTNLENPFCLPDMELALLVS